MFWKKSILKCGICGYKIDTSWIYGCPVCDIKDFNYDVEELKRFNKLNFGGRGKNFAIFFLDDNHLFGLKQKGRKLIFLKTSYVEKCEDTISLDVGKYSGTTYKFELYNKGFSDILSIYRETRRKKRGAMRLNWHFE